MSKGKSSKDVSPDKKPGPLTKKEREKRKTYKNLIQYIGNDEKIKIRN